MEIDIKIMVENRIEDKINYQREIIDNCAYGKRELYELSSLENMLFDEEKIEKIAEKVYDDDELTSKIIELIDYYIYH